MKIFDQKQIFFSTEGNAWFKRNSKTLENEYNLVETCPILSTIKQMKILPKKVLEVGASNGWRLNALHASTNANCIGVEPSENAVTNAMKNYKNITMIRGTADNLPCQNLEVDLVILGFCLYLCDRQDLFRIAAECDRVLKNQGFLMILDFNSSFAYRKNYKHHPDIFTYKMNYESMFNWNPSYRLIKHSLTDHNGGQGNDPNDRLSLSVLIKDLNGGYIDNPYES